MCLPITKCLLFLNALLFVFNSAHFQFNITDRSFCCFIFPLEVNYDLLNNYSKTNDILSMFRNQNIITFLFSGIPYQQKSVQLKCVVECYPLCDLVWHRNNTPIPITNKRSLAGGIFQGSGQLDTYSRFTVQTEHKPANSVENVLEHVQSVLTLVSIKPVFNQFVKL